MQRILSPYQPCGPRPVPFVPHPLRANPGPSMPPPTAKMRSPQAANRRTGERERETARPLSVAVPTGTARAPPPRVRRAHRNVSMTCGPGIPWWGPRRNYGKRRCHYPRREGASPRPRLRRLLDTHSHCAKRAAERTGNQPTHPHSPPSFSAVAADGAVRRLAMESAHKSGGGSTPGKCPPLAGIVEMYLLFFFTVSFLMFVRCDGVVWWFRAQEREPEPEGRAFCATRAGTSTPTGTRAPSSGARTGSTAASRRPPLAPAPRRRRAPGSTTAATCF